ncbi:MAG: hypothetical protein QOH21_1964 [Acidobacteriota bacterium]|jgi:hypothetical protein|nr:hypothetical protein [Acidobacteriota bacterium]
MRKLALLLLLAATPLTAQIADNSFLIEEAYNQEPGVVQHIALAQFATKGGDWASSFTQEWPAGSLRHQLSYTATALRADGSTGVGDFALNYRYQLVGDGESRLAISPRLSLVLPLGDEDAGRGAGATGVQFMLPVSLVLSPRFVAHWNAGVALTPARDQRAWTAGQSIVWLAHPRVNALVETVWTRNDLEAGARETTLVISPGIRWSYNLPGGLQIVPGIAIPFSVRGEDSRAVIAYLSFEHPFSRKGK